MIEDCAALILAGGESHRMGRDKATLVLGEQTLLQRVTTALHPLFQQVVVSVRQTRQDIDWPQVCDAVPNAGPLAGLCAGLNWAKANSTGWVFATATDMPFLQPILIEDLGRRRGDFDAVVPMIDGHPQPLAAFYFVGCLAIIERLLSGAGRRSLRAALEQLNVCYVHESELRGNDPGLRSFLDLDTPDDVIAAAQLKESV